MTSVGLVGDDAVVACNGVTECDHAINTATTIPIPIVPVVKNSLNMIASFVLVDAPIMSQPRFRTLPSLLQIDVVNIHLFRRDRKLWRRLRDKLGMIQQPHGSVTQCRPWS
jgi:hypothetical protein